MAALLQTFSIVDPVVGKFQDNVRKAINPLLAHPFAGGVLLETQSLSTNVAYVSHGLGRVPAGWFAVSPSANETIYEDVVTTNPDSFNILLLKASGAITAKIFVF